MSQANAGKRRNCVTHCSGNHRRSVFAAAGGRVIRRNDTGLDKRRAMVAAINQQDEMIATMGEDPATWRAPVGYFVPSSKCANDAGMEAVTKHHGVDEIKAMLDKAGYDGGRIAFMHPTDQLAYDALSNVAIDAFRKAGLNIDDQQTDWGTILQRRNSKAPLDKGGCPLVEKK